MEFVDSRKILIGAIFFVLSILILSFIAVAHSASNMSLSYNSTINELQVDITHQVSNPNTHYVNNIIIKINGETNLSSDYSSQPGSGFSYTYTGIKLSEGDVIEVTATCNQGGSISKQLTISSEGVSNNGDDSSTPGFELILFIISVIAFLIILNKDK